MASVAGLAGGYALQAVLVTAGVGAIHVVFCALVYLAVALGAARVLGPRPRAGVLVGRLSGITMILVLVALTAERALSGP